MPVTSMRVTSMILEIMAQRARGWAVFSSVTVYRKLM